MATVNFSVPDEVKEAFNTAFSGRNKSAVIADLMRRAVREEEGRTARARAIDELLARREERPAASVERVREALAEIREGC